MSNQMGSMLDCFRFEILGENLNGMEIGVINPLFGHPNLKNKLAQQRKMTAVFSLMIQIFLSILMVSLYVTLKILTQIVPFDHVETKGFSLSMCHRILIMHQYFYLSPRRKWKEESKAIKSVLLVS